MKSFLSDTKHVLLVIGLIIALFFIGATVMEKFDNATGYGMEDGR